MPGTGDVIYVLGPSLIALALGLVILVIILALRRGPTVAARSAPDHGVPQSAPRVSGYNRPLIPAQRHEEDGITQTRTADGGRLFVRPRRSRAHPRRHPQGA